MKRDIDFVPVLKTLDSICQKHGKRYCYPAQETIRGLLDKFYEIRISTRTLNRWLKKLEEAGYIKRKRRITRRALTPPRFQSTLYALKGKAYKIIGRVVKLFSGFKKKLARDLEHKKMTPADSSTEVISPGGAQVPPELEALAASAVRSL